MRTKMQPTDEKNLTARLYFRYFLFYLLAVPFALFFARRSSFTVNTATVGKVECAFLLLALLSAFCTLQKPLLFCLTAAKAFLDTALLLRSLTWVKRGDIRPLPFNVFLLFLFACLFLYCVGAAHASRFAFQTTKRDAKLLFSRPFLLFLSEILVFAALALALVNAWGHIAVLLGLPPVR